VQCSQSLKPVYHGLGSSASPVSTATGFVNGRGQFLTPPPQTSHPLTYHQKYVSSDYVSDPYGCGKFGVNLSMGPFGQTGGVLLSVDQSRRTVYLRHCIQVTSSRRRLSEDISV